ncbi:MAG: cysteine--tRNA ligase [Candidatus Magasanikbacteria bacterium]|nr:cysteine--tRNA ligase [Candidatus Magasanikbacteria bacterium]
MPELAPQIFLSNSLHRQKELFKPIKRGRVGLYTCGPTVYNYAHIGNLRTYVFEDILKRTLLYNGYNVNHVMNITDVGHLTSDADEGEDKMAKGAAREGKSAQDIAKFYEAAFLNDLEELNILPANKLPRATDHIKEQIALIKKLAQKGFTYKTVDGIYFDTSQLEDYGKLANLKNQELRAGARVGIGDKKNITDFALWKFSPPLGNRQMEWASPWRVGFPGWHIECSAMAIKYLGQPFDIHCGGIDHIPVHHTNEIAQSEAATGKPLANYWLHGEFLLTKETEKMAKSSENFITLQTLKNKDFSPLAYRYFLLQTHYRKQATFSFEALAAAQNGLTRLYETARGWGAPKIGCAEYEQKFLTCINDDLNTPSALALMWQLVKSDYPDAAKKQTLLKFDEVLGLKIKENTASVSSQKNQPLPQAVEELKTARNAARVGKNWAESDRLRLKLEKLGYEVKDTKNGTEVRKK